MDESDNLYLDKAQLYFVRTTPVKYRMYLETMFCKTYGDKVRAAFYASANIRCYGKDEVFKIANFPKEAFEKNFCFGIKFMCDTDVFTLKEIEEES